MTSMGVYDQLKKALQDVVAPEIQVLSAKMDGLDRKIDSVDDRVITKIDSLRAEIVSEIRRVDTRIDALDREIRTAIDIRERLAALEARRPA